MADSVSEADFSEEQGTGSTGTGGKASELKKKERIRDNQRRSRARRQEHLADLEKRVAASHAACREAEMQQGAFRDAQIENVRLRDLLRIAGVNEQVVQSYVNQGINQVGAGGDSTTRTMRTLRPRMETGERRRRSSARTSPYPDGGEVGRLSVERQAGSARLSPASLPSSRELMGSQVLPMTGHMLPGAHIQHFNVFQPASPQRDDDACWGGFELPSNGAWRA